MRSIIPIVTYTLHVDKLLFCSTYTMIFPQKSIHNFSVHYGTLTNKVLR